MTNNRPWGTLIPKGCQPKAGGRAQRRPRPPPGSTPPNDFLPPSPPGRGTGGEGRLPEVEVAWALAPASLKERTRVA